MNKLRIAVVGSLYQPIAKNSTAGTEIWTYNFVEQLVKRGAKVTLFADSESAVAGEVAGAANRERLIDRKTGSLSREKNIFFSINEMLEVIRRQEEFDIIHLSVFGFYYYLPLTKLIKKPVVVTFHGYSSFDYGDMEDTFRSVPNPHYVYISKSFARNWPVPPKCTIIENGVDTENFKYSDGPGDILFWMGRICKEKGIEDLMKLAQSSSEQVVIAGPIGDEQLFDQAVKPNLSQRVQYVGELDFSQKLGYYQRAKALLFTSKINEGLPLVPLEALACGTTVLAYNRDPLQEIITDGKNGWLVKPDDVADLANKAAKVVTINRRDCRASVEDQFSIDRMMGKYSNLYKEILTGVAYAKN